MVKHVRPPPRLKVIDGGRAPKKHDLSRLGGVLAEFLEQRPTLRDMPVTALYLSLLEHRPRAARCLLPWVLDTPDLIPLIALVDGLQHSLDPSVDGLREGLAAVTIAWPPPREDLQSLADAIVAAKIRDVPVASFVQTAMGRTPDVAGLTMNVRESLKHPIGAAYVTHIFAARAAVAALRKRPIRWPLLVGDDEPYADERREVLAVLSERRGGRDAGFSSRVLRAAFYDASLRVRVRGPSYEEERTLSTRTWELAAHPGNQPSVEENVYAFAFDLLNEPHSAGERDVIATWVRPKHDAVLQALRAFVAPAPVSQERLAWQVDGERDWVHVVARRQRPRARGDGFVKGTEVSAHDVLTDPAPYITDQDRAAAGFLASVRPSSYAALRALAGHPYTFDSAGLPITVRAATLTVALDDDDDGGARVRFMLGDRVVPAQEMSSPFLIVRDGPTIIIAPVDDRTYALAGAVLGAARLPPKARPALEALADDAIATSTLALPPSLQGELRESAPRAVLRLTLTGEQTTLRLTARVSIVPGPGAPFVSPGDGGAIALALTDGVRVRYARDHDSERGLARPVVLGLVGDGERVVLQDDDEWVVAADADATPRLLERALAQGVEVVWRDQRRAQLVTPQSSLKVRVSAARDWLGLDGSVEIDGEQVSLAVLLAAVRHQRRYVQLSRDRFAALDDALREGLRAVAALTTDQGDDAGTVEVPWAAAPALEVLQQSGAEFEEGEVWQQLSRRLAQARAVDDVPPLGLVAELRPYQRDGLLFLRRLAAFGAGGVLADDMGLGKTIQAIALLLDRAAEGPAVVVVPTSLVFNWLRELSQFAPSLRPVVYGDATDRQAALASVGPGDVLIVTYGLVDDAFAPAATDVVAADVPQPVAQKKKKARAQGLVERVERARFATAIFDEAQAIKNADTQRARACRDLDATIKIALSGTPLENHLGELWSLFRVVCPGLFGSVEQFRRRFLVPIERDRSVQHRRQLGQTVRPFMLRRSKAEVLPELPPLTHQLIDVTASADERAIYDALRVEILTDIDDGAEVTDKRFRVLAGLTRLRLCCCHPVLVEPSYGGRSAKLDAAVATIEHVRAAGHKALVFSQFVKFLDLVEPALVSAGVRVLRLDGATPEAQRRQRVDAFQRGEADVFLLSLKAGGAGLNLTAADVVLHLDPWWNPAVEAQAIARAHRMGRAEPVTAVRVVVRDTIEAAILQMHDDKRELVDAVLSGAGAGTPLSLDEIAALLTTTAGDARA